MMPCLSSTALPYVSSISSKHPSGPKKCRPTMISSTGRAVSTLISSYRFLKGINAHDNLLGMQLYQLSFVQFNAVLLLRSDLALVNVSIIPSLFNTSDPKVWNTDDLN